MAASAGGIGMARSVLLLGRLGGVVEDAQQ
jgi:hypothetical protein